MNSTANQVAGDGNINDSECRLYNDFAQLTQSYQALGGTVNTATTPKVQYSYADGSSNTVNEIASLVNETSKAWTTPGYDKAGNMTRIPVPGTPPDGVAWNTMSLSDWDNLKLADWEEMTLDNVEGVYDAWNRLVRLHVGDTTLAEYSHEAPAILPPLPQFFAVSASFHMATSPERIGGEGSGEGAVFACCHPRKPPHPAWRPPSTPDRVRSSDTQGSISEAADQAHYPH